LPGKKSQLTNPNHSKNHLLSSSLFENYRNRWFCL